METLSQNNFFYSVTADLLFPTRLQNRLRWAPHSLLGKPSRQAVRMGSKGDSAKDPVLHHEPQGGEEMGQMQGQKPPGVLILAWGMEERKAGPAVASGVLLWFMLPPVGCCHCHLPSYSNQSMSLSGPPGVSKPHLGACGTSRWGSPTSQSIHSPRPGVQLR